MVAVISILIAISVPVYTGAGEKAERRVLEYNTKVVARVLLPYVQEQRENGVTVRTLNRSLLGVAIGDPSHPLHGQIDGSSMKDTKITYLQIKPDSPEYIEFHLVWKKYEADYQTGEPIKIIKTE